MSDSETNQDRKIALLSALSEILDKVEKIDCDECPNNQTMCDLLMKDWIDFQRDIVREILKRKDIKISVNAGFGGGMEDPGVHWIAFIKSKNLPTLSEEEWDKNIDEILGIR